MLPREAEPQTNVPLGHALTANEGTLAPYPDDSWLNGVRSQEVAIGSFGERTH